MKKSIASISETFNDPFQDIIWIIHTNIKNCNRTKEKIFKTCLLCKKDLLVHKMPKHKSKRLKLIAKNHINYISSV